MELLQFDTKLISNSEIKIPDNLKQKIELNKEVKILVIPAGEKLYDDWEDDEWTAWVSLIDRSCYLEVIAQPDNADQQELHPRAKSAIAAMVESLRRRREYVPTEVSLKLKIPQQNIPPYGSASAHLVGVNDYARALAIFQTWHADYPADCAMGELRKIVSEMVPLRAADGSSLTTRCITPGGGLVIERVGYNKHKTDNAIRIVSLSEANATLLREKIAGLEIYLGERLLLFRGDCSWFTIR